MMRRWEALDTWKQILIAGPLLVVIMFALNALPFQQPLERSIGYGFIEGVPFTALLIVATRHERAKREQARRQASNTETPDDPDRA